MKDNKDQYSSNEGDGYTVWNSSVYVHITLFSAKPLLMCMKERLKRRVSWERGWGDDDNNVNINLEPSFCTQEISMIFCKKHD